MFGNSPNPVKHKDSILLTISHMACGEIPKWEIGELPRANGAETTRKIILRRDPRDGAVIFEDLTHGKSHMNQGAEQIESAFVPGVPSTEAQ